MEQTLFVQTKNGTITAEELLAIDPLNELLCLRNTKDGQGGSISYGPNDPNIAHDSSIVFKKNTIELTGRNVLINNVDILNKIETLENDNRKLKRTLNELSNLSDVGPINGRSKRSKRRKRGEN